MAIYQSFADSNAAAADTFRIPTYVGSLSDTNATPVDAFAVYTNAVEATPVQVWSVAVFGTIGRVLVPRDQGSPA